MYHLHQHFCLDNGGKWQVFPIRLPFHKLGGPTVVSPPLFLVRNEMPLQQFAVSVEPIEFLERISPAILVFGNEVVRGEDFA